MPIKNIPSKTPAPPMDMKPELMLWILFILSKSAPINTPNTPETKAQGAAKSGANAKAKIAEKMGGIIAVSNPFLGSIWKKIRNYYIKTVAISTGFKEKSFKIISTKK
jgi:hypothetical protein